MSNFKEIKNELMQLGLSEGQALIYLALVQHEELRIQEISQLTKIPRSSVYDNLEILFKLGIIEKVIEDKFIKLKPYSINSIRHNLNEKLLDLQVKISKLDGLERAISYLPKNGKNKSTIVRYYRGVSGARQLLWNTLKSKETILVYSAWGRGRYVGIKFYKSFVTESKIRGFKEKVLINPSPRVLESIKAYAGTSISRTSPQDIKAISENNLLIKGETFIYENIYSQLYLREEEIGGFEVESPNFTQMQRSIFNTLWNMSDPISSLLAQTSIKNKIQQQRI